MFIVGQICDELTFRALQFSITTLKWHRLQAMFTWLFDYQIKYRNWFTVEQSTTPIAKYILEENITLCLHSRSMHLQTGQLKDSFVKSSHSWIKIAPAYNSMNGNEWSISGTQNRLFLSDMLAPERETPWSGKKLTL